MMIPLFDLHADTLGKMYKNKELLKENNLHISLKKAKSFAPYIQVMAIWSDFRLNDEEAYNNFYKILDYAHSQNVNFATSKNELNHGAFVLGVEDARLLGGKIERLDSLFNCGVRVLTLNWQGNSLIGGAWDTKNGLTEFGKNVLLRSLELGIIPDISHSSDKSAYEAIEIARSKSKPIIASHSNSYSVFNHKRNLTDTLFCEISSLGGLVGISLVPEHLSKDASIHSILKHAYHFLSLSGENTVCLGCDLDGVDALPEGISGICDLNLLFSLFLCEFGEKITNKIFFQNAYNFFAKSFH